MCAMSVRMYPPELTSALKRTWTMVAEKRIEEVEMKRYVVYSNYLLVINF